MCERTCVVGCGRWGRNLVRAFSELAALDAVCDASFQRAAAFGARYGVRVLSWSDVLGDASVSSVVVATPSARHFALASEALDAGKHVFVEKPVALFAHEACALAQKARRHGLVLMVGHIMLYHPAFLRLKELVRSGVVGSVRSVATCRTSWGRVHGQPDTPGEDDDVLWDLAPHDVSMILDVLGGAMPSHTEAWGSCCFSHSIQDKTSPRYDEVRARLTFRESDAQAFLHVSWIGPEKKRTLTVVGERGILLLDDVQPWDRKLVLYTWDPEQKPDLGDGLEISSSDCRTIRVAEQEPLMNECAAFLAAIARKKGKKQEDKKRCLGGLPDDFESGRDGVDVLEVLEAVRGSVALARFETGSAEAERPAAKRRGESAGEEIPFVNLARQQAPLRTSIDAAVARVLDHGQYILGPEVQELEEALGSYCGAKHAITCSDGTAALVLALMALGVKAGDVVAVPSFTFVATAEAVVLCGGTPLFIDVREDTYNVDVECFRSALEDSSRSRAKPVGIITVDLFGQPADYTAIGLLARQHGMWVLADAAQSFGASWNGSKVGTLADITCTSFFPSKPLGCYGDGGALFTNNDEYASLLRSLRNHGAGRSRYDNARVGMNSRLDSIQAAVLLQKLRVYDRELESRRRAARLYGTLLHDQAGLQLPGVNERADPCWALYTVCLGEDQCARRDNIIDEMQKRGVCARIYYQTPVHRQPAYEGFGKGTYLPASDRLARRVLSLPIGCGMSEEDLDRVAKSLLGSLNRLWA